MRRRARRSTTRDGCVVRIPAPAWGVRTGGDPGAGIRCDRLVELVTDYLEGDLDEATAAEFEAHLARCAGCDAYVDQMRQTARRLGHVSLDGLPDATRARLLEAFGVVLG